MDINICNVLKDKIVIEIEHSDSLINTHRFLVYQHSHLLSHTAFAFLYHQLNLSEDIMYSQHYKASSLSLTSHIYTRPAYTPLTALFA